VPSSLVSSVFGTGPGKQESYTYKQMTITIAKELPQSILNSGVMSSSFLSDMQQQRYECVLVIRSTCSSVRFALNSCVPFCLFIVKWRVMRLTAAPALLVYVSSPNR